MFIVVVFEVDCMWGLVLWFNNIIIFFGLFNFVVMCKGVRLFGFCRFIFVFFRFRRVLIIFL